ncbi:MAG TPA: hypothetical protein VGK74_02435 [Symbiobacteriaceae bacterium]
MGKDIDLTKPFAAECYYVKHPKHGWYGYFTIAPALGLLQIHGDFGIYAARWSAPGPDFKAFLLRISADYLTSCLEQTVSNTVSLRTQKTLDEVQKRLGHMAEHLWPFFIERLRAEREEAAVAAIVQAAEPKVMATIDRLWPDPETKRDGIPGASRPADSEKRTG